MRTRILIELEIEGEAQDAYDIAERLLDNGDLQNLFKEEEAIDVGPLRVTSAVVSSLEGDLREILWPEGNAEAEHNADTLEAVARRLDYLRPAAATS